MSFAINQAETFNYKTNYEVANVSHLTQPSLRAERDIFRRSRGGEEGNQCGGEDKGGM